MTINNLSTPFIFTDMAIVKSNIKRMQELCNRHNCTLRPHIKTHKSVEIARLQVDAGAVGITCAKVSEAEVMADGGIDDIFIAYPLVGNKIDRAVSLFKRVKRLILAVDSLAGAAALSEAAVMHGIKFEVRMEIDTGAGRTGVPVRNADLAVAVSKLPGIELTGIFTFKGMTHLSRPTTDSVQAAREECEMLCHVQDMLLAQGIVINDLSVGSTPTGPACAATGLVNEIRPGTYVYNDQMCVLQGACSPNDIAARIFATVVSVAADYAVIDGGSKTFPTDIGLNQPPFFAHSYGYIKGCDNLRLDRVNEEHGIIRTVEGGSTGLTVGDVLEIIPIHICTAVNLQNYIYMEENNSIKKSKVDARGMLV